MNFTSFFYQFPEFTETEFRCISIIDEAGYKDIPVGDYAFDEFFCDTPGCDCCNTMIHVLDKAKPGKPLAIIRYGWQPKAFYYEWMGEQCSAAEALCGISLDLQSPNNPVSRGFLALYREIIQHDVAYAERIKRHYHLFKAKIAGSSTQTPCINNTMPYRRTERIGRNVLCYCGSGKKYKKCCQGKAGNGQLPPELMGKKVSVVFLDFAEPFLEFFLAKNPGLSLEQLNESMELPWTVWNAVVVKESEAQPVDFVASLKLLAKDRTPEEKMVLNELIERKNQLFSQYHYMIGDYGFYEDSVTGECRFWAEAKMPNKQTVITH